MKKWEKVAVAVPEKVEAVSVPEKVEVAVPEKVSVCAAMILAAKDRSEGTKILQEALLAGLDQKAILQEVRERMAEKKAVEKAAADAASAAAGTMTELFGVNYPEQFPEIVGEGGKVNGFLLTKVVYGVEFPKGAVVSVDVLFHAVLRAWEQYVEAFPGVKYGKITNPPTTHIRGRVRSNLCDPEGITKKGLGDKALILVHKVNPDY